jgi:GTP-binding protein LepA
MLSLGSLRFNGTDSSPRKSVSILTDRDILDTIPIEDVRYFCFIAHVDHGKSSLASRVLELCGNLGPEAQKIAEKAARGDDSLDNTDATHERISNSQKEKIELLDTLRVEQERGITVKASAATMLYRHPSAVGPSGVLLLNMVDTPGHVDFGREVSRSLSFVDGSVLLLDASQGIQAQTWSVYEKVKALENPPELLVALTKVDLDAARPIHVALTVSEWLSWDDPDSIIITSARNRVGITDILDAVCRQVPPPKTLEDDDGSILRAVVVDSWYDSRGVNCLVKIASGELTESDRIAVVNDANSVQNQSFSVQECGLLLPHAVRTGRLKRGQMGYVRFGLRDPRQAMKGSVLIFNKDVGKSFQLPSLPDSSSSESVLYASVHPIESDGFEDLCHAVDKLALNDTGLQVSKVASLGGIGGENGGPFLGPGIRVGFQGLLHVEVFRQRLSDEFNLEAIVTPPKVPYRITFLPSRRHNTKESHSKVIEDLSEWPDPGTRFTVEEPVVQARIIAPVEYAGSVMELMKRKRATEMETKPIDEDTWLFSARMPWGEVVTDFHDDLKNATAGYGSLDTQEADPPLQLASLSKVDILLNNEEVEPLAFVCHKDTAQAEARVVCKKLQEVLPRQQFVTVIQAKADGKIIASERIRAYRKDVLTTGGSKAVGGGDVTRKKEAAGEAKERQKETTSYRSSHSQPSCIQQCHY